jgi:hypothetical protein
MILKKRHSEESRLGGTTRNLNGTENKVGEIPRPLPKPREAGSE